MDKLKVRREGCSFRGAAAFHVVTLVLSHAPSFCLSSFTATLMVLFFAS